MRNVTKEALFWSAVRKKKYLCSDVLRLTHSKTMTALTITMIVLAFILTTVGMIGAIIPALPGPPLCLAGLALIYWFVPGTISMQLLIFMIVLTVCAVLLDYLTPILLTRVGGGSKQAVMCTTLGLVAGLFFMPAGLILGPLIGAFVGEYSETQRLGKALWVAFLSFVSFLFTTVTKVILAAVMTYYVEMAVISVL